MQSEAGSNRNVITKADIAAMSKEVNNWGRWGKDDEVGTLNFVTEEAVAAAARLIVKGKRFSLGLPFDQNGPQNGNLGRVNPLHFMRLSGVDSHAGLRDDYGLQSADDWLILPLQSSTHWDGLGHIFYENRMYNGFLSTEVSSYGAKKSGIEVNKDKYAGRGVLLDVARALGKDVLPPGFAITGEILDETAHKANVEIRTGDFLIFRTGQMEQCLAAGSWDDFAGGDAPGLAFETARWLHRKEVAAIACDTWGCEVRPNNAPGIRQPWHWVVIPAMGLAMGEMFNLKELAEDCAADGRYEFFFCAPTIIVTGSVSGPINPMAFK